MFFMMFLNLISFCRDLVSGSNDVSALKSKFVWLIVPPPPVLRSVLSLLMRCRHEDSCHSMSSRADDGEADFPLELR